MPKITKISCQAHKSDRMNIFVDNKFLTSLDKLLCIQYGLKINQEISQATCQKLIIQNQQMAVYNKALKLLAIRPQSIAEMRQKLAKHSWDKIMIQKVIHRLIQENLLNDSQFAAYWINSRINNRLRSSRHLISELFQKGVAKDVIAQALQPINPKIYDIETATRIWQTKMKSHQLTPEQLIKIKSHLARKGFSYPTIITAEKNLRLDAQDSA